jgi:hypothetical protein
VKRSILTLVTVALATAGLGVAEAAPKPPCRIVTDATGDSTRGSGLDIVSGDLASTRTMVTAVFRLAEVTKSNASAPTGQGYYFQFNAGGETPIYLSYTVTPTSETFSYGWVDGSINHSLGAAKGVVDVAKKEVRVSAPVGAWGTYGTPRAGSRLTELGIETFWVVGAYVNTPETGSNGGGSLQPADDAIGKTYVAGSPSCVAVGK